MASKVSNALQHVSLDAGSGAQHFKVLNRGIASLGASACVVLAFSGCGPAIYSSQGSGLRELDQTTAHIRKMTGNKDLAAYFKLAMKKENVAEGRLGEISSTAMFAYRHNDSTFFCGNSPRFSTHCREEDAIAAIDRKIGLSLYLQEVMNSGQNIKSSIKNLKKYKPHQNIISAAEEVIVGIAAFLVLAFSAGAFSDRVKIREKTNLMLLQTRKLAMLLKDSWNRWKERS